VNGRCRASGAILAAHLETFKLLNLFPVWKSFWEKWPGQLVDLCCGTDCFGFLGRNTVERSKIELGVENMEITVGKINECYSLMFYIDIQV